VQVEVTFGETYTLSAYAMANEINGFPSPIINMAYHFRTTASAILGHPWQYIRWGNSSSGEWKEMSTTFTLTDLVFFLLYHAHAIPWPGLGAGAGSLPPLPNLSEASVMSEVSR